MRQSCAELLEEYKQSRPRFTWKKLRFIGIGDQDVYNVTAPFQDDGEWVIAGRVEARHTEHSVVRFFVEEKGIWCPHLNAPTFNLQDPFVTRIGAELIFGGVEVYPHPTIPGALAWRTNFYRGTSISNLEKFASGPDGMKDIRLVEIARERIGVFTRPQGEIGGRGTIGFTEVATLDHLTIRTIAEAPLLDQFVPEEWGGANEVHLLKNGLLGVLGHIACFDHKGDRHYYPMVFAFDVEARQATPMKLIATRADFPAGPAKRSDLQDVVFSGGLRRLPNGRAEFYAGVSDAEAHCLGMKDPFLEYESTGGLP